MVNFDSRGILVTCSGACGQVVRSVSFLDNALEANRQGEAWPVGDAVVWLFGRGLSIDCGLSWDTPQDWKSLPRDERIARTKVALRAETDALLTKTKAADLRHFLDFLGRETVDGCRHLFITTNWDDLLERALASLGFEDRPSWLKDTHVFHLNGTVECLPDNSNRSPFLLPDDPAEERTRTVEGNVAFNQMIWELVFVVVGMSFECQADKFLLRHLNMVEDNLPIGKSLWVIVNRDVQALASVCSRIQQALPRARIVPVCRTFTEWRRAGFRELEREGVFRVRCRAFLGQG